MAYKAFSSFQHPGINMRKELDVLYNTDKTAHWVVYRRFDLTKKSDHYVDILGEGVGGPKYQYTDELIEVRRTLVRRLVQNEESINVPAQLQDSMVNYYIKYDVNPKVSDIIYEITYSGPSKPGSIPPPDQFVTKYNITAVFPMRDAEYGRIEYYLVYAEASNV